MGRRLASIVLVLALLAAAVAVDAQDRGPVAEFRETTKDFGQVFEEAEYRHVFVVRNKGKADLIIEDVKPG